VGWVVGSCSPGMVVPVLLSGILARPRGEGLGYCRAVCSAFSVAAVGVLARLVVAAAGFVGSVCVVSAGDRAHLVAAGE